MNCPLQRQQAQHGSKSEKEHTFSSQDLVSFQEKIKNLNLTFAMKKKYVYSVLIFFLK